METLTSANSLSQLQALIIAGLQKPESGCIPFAIVPEGYEFKSTESLQEKPNRIRATVNLLTSDSFIDYINRFIDPRTVIFADPNAVKFTAVLDYHETNADPEWAQHKAIYACPLSENWVAWNKYNKSKMNQLEFAEFIETHIH